MAKILIVDDSPSTVEILKKALEGEGHVISVAMDGLAGLNTAKQEMPDLIVLDLMLPKLDGFKVCKLLKFDSKYKDIKILMLTSKLSDEDRKLGEEAGADAYVTKNAGLAEIVERVRRLVST